MENTDTEEKNTTQGCKKDSPFVDNILRALNPTGRYQILHIIALLLSMPNAAFQLFSNVFTAKDIPHKCSGPPEGSDWVEVFGDTQNLTVLQHTCTLVLTDNSSVLNTAACAYGIDYELDTDASVASQFDLVCDLKWLVKLSQTMVIFGQGVGATLITYASDRFGRKTIIVASNMGLFVCGLVVAYSPNVIIFIVFKFLIGGFQQGMALTSATYFLELLPLEYRATQAWLGGSTWGLSVILFSLIAFLFRHHSWRTLQVAISLASATAFLQFWYMDESLRWLFANGKTKEATNTMRRIARVNKRNIDRIFEQLQAEHNSMQMKTHRPTAKEDGEIKATKHLTLLEILKVRRLLLNSVCIWFGWFTAALSFFTIYLTATTLSGDPYLNFGLTALMELPSNMFFYFCLNRLGRKQCLRIVFITMGTGVILAGIFKKLEEKNSLFTTFTLLASLVAMCGASGCFGIVYSYTPEMYPTNLRSQASGVASSMARIGGMLAPFAGFLAEQAVWAPGLVIGSCAYTVCFLSHFLPETTGRELPQTTLQVQGWFKEKDTEIVKDQETSELPGVDRAMLSQTV